jgi:hypothetical protein
MPQQQCYIGGMMAPPVVPALKIFHSDSIKGLQFNFNGLSPLHVLHFPASSR